MSRDPDLVGVGFGWRFRRENFDSSTPEMQAKLRSFCSSWIVRGPWHPFWSEWYLYVIALHDEDDDVLGPVSRHYPEAQYEFGIHTINPGRGRRYSETDIELVEKGTGQMSFLSPPDCIYQFHGVTREQAADICDHAAAAIVRGLSSPDSDYRTWWMQAIENAVRHHKGEAHLPHHPGGGR